MKNKKIKTKPVIFIWLVIGILFVSYIAGVLPFNLFLSLIVYSCLYTIVLKQRKTVKILTDLIILNFLITYDNLSQLIKRKFMLGSRSLLFLKIIIFLDHRLPTVLNILYKKAYAFVYSVLLFLSVKLPRQIRRTVKLILKPIVYSVITLLELINYSVTKLLILINSFTLQLSLIFSYLTAIYLSKKASLTRFVGIAVFVLIILFFFIGVKPGEESIKFVGAAGGACTYDSSCDKCENCPNTCTNSYNWNGETNKCTEGGASSPCDPGFCGLTSTCGDVASGVEDTINGCYDYTGCSATSGDYCRCNGAASCLTLNNGYCIADTNCFNHCDAEDGSHETLYGLSTDNLVCFSGVACVGGLVKCGSHDGDCQYNAASATNCDDYSEGSTVGSTGYCDSNCGYHAKGTYKFYVQGSGGVNVASFDNAGNVVISGTLTQNSGGSPTGGNDFIIKGGGDVERAWIDGVTGNMYLKGTMKDGQAISPPANSFIIQNSGGTAVSYIDSSGNLRLSGAFVAGGTP